MASNAKTKARKAKSEERQIRWYGKFRRDIAKTTPQGEEHRNHYVGGGQAFTRKETK